MSKTCIIPNGGRVARLRGAKVSWDTFNFRTRVRYQSDRARAHGDVILGQANCVLAAAVLNADGSAGVSGTIARLCSRTVRVGQAIDLATAFRSGWVSSVEACRRTSAFGGVVVGHTNGSRSAPNRRANGDTAADTVNGV